MCKNFAAELMERMTAQGLKGEVGNMIYDNLFPKGIEYSKWLMDLEVGSWVLPL